MPLSIRPLTLTDVEAFHLLEQELFPADPWSPPQITEELANPWAYYLGAFEADQLVGAGGIKGTPDADLMTMGVHPTFRRQGAANALLRQLLRHALSNNVEKVFLEVRESNRAAIAFYQKAGFVTIGKVRGYYHRPAEAALTMVLQIAS